MNQLGDSVCQILDGSVCQAHIFVKIAFILTADSLKT